MMHRRHFVSAAAALVSLGPAARLFGKNWIASPNTSDRWTCQAIQTVARDNVNQPPVVTGVSIQPSGNWLAVVGDDHTVSLLDLSRLEFVSHFARHRDWVRSAKFSPDGKYLATAGNDARLLLWDMESPGQVRELATQPQAIIQLDVSPDGKRIATVGFDDQLRMYSVTNGRREWSAECPCNDMDATAFSVDGNWVAAGGRSGVIRIWDSSSAAVRTEFQAQRSRIRSIEFTDDGQIVSCGNDCAVKITNPDDPESARTLARQNSKLFAVKLLTENRLATGGSDDAIHIWDLTTLEHIEMLSGHVGTVSCLDSLNTMLVSGSYDTQVRIWDSQVRSAAIESPEAGTNWNAKGLLK